MDIFKEQMVRKATSRNEKISKVLIVISSAALAFMCFIFTFGGAFTIFGIFLAGCALYGGYYLVTGIDAEYEYIITNGEMDVDKIIAQRKRKRLCTVSIKSATAFGAVGSGDFEEKTDNADTYVEACGFDPDPDGAVYDYYIRLKHKSLGDTVVFFSPSEEMLGIIKSYLPRALR